MPRHFCILTPVSCCLPPKPGEPFFRYRTFKVEIREMKKLILIGLLAIVWAGCSKPGEGKNSSWRVTAVTPVTGFCTPGMMVILEKERLRMVSGNSSVEFPALFNDDRLVADTGMAKILFSVVKTSDSTMVWEELYTSSPLVIHLTTYNQ